MSLDAQVQYSTGHLQLSGFALFAPSSTVRRTNSYGTLGGIAIQIPPKVPYRTQPYGSSKSVTTDLGRNTVLIHTDQ